MTKSKQKNSDDMSTQLSIFDIVQERRQMTSDDKPKTGSFNIKDKLSQMLSDGLKEFEGSRYEAAAKMSELCNQEITKTMLDSWTAESKTNHRFPAEYMPAFCFVTGYKEPLIEMARMIDCHLLESEDALLAELGKIEETKRELDAKEEAIKNFIQKMR